MNIITKIKMTVARSVIRTRNRILAKIGQRFKIHRRRALIGRRGNLQWDHSLVVGRNEFIFEGAVTREDMKWCSRIVWLHTIFRPTSKTFGMARCVSTESRNSRDEVTEFTSNPYW